jgi:hypothetical protein
MVRIGQKEPLKNDYSYFLWFSVILFSNQNYPCYDKQKNMLAVF